MDMDKGVEIDCEGGVGGGRRANWDNCNRKTIKKFNNCLNMQRI